MLKKHLVLKPVDFEKSEHRTVMEDQIKFFNDHTKSGFNRVNIHAAHKDTC